VALRQFMIIERPGGPLRGIAGHHLPTRGTWRADAEHLWRVLGGRSLGGR
jgi:hypothetical protein